MPIVHMLKLQDKPHKVWEKETVKPYVLCNFTKWEEQKAYLSIYMFWTNSKSTLATSRLAIVVKRLLRGAITLNRLLNMSLYIQHVNVSGVHITPMIVLSLDSTRHKQNHKPIRVTLYLWNNCCFLVRWVYLLYLCTNTSNNQCLDEGWGIWGVY